MCAPFLFRLRVMVCNPRFGRFGYVDGSGSVAFDGENERSEAAKQPDHEPHRRGDPQHFRRPRLNDGEEEGEKHPSDTGERSKG